MSRHRKTFAPRVVRYEEQAGDYSQEDSKYAAITNQDVTISLAKGEVTKITYEPFKNQAFKKIESGRSILRFSNNNSAVLAVNKALKKLGYKAPEKEALFLYETQYALTAFQRDNDITASAVFDAATLLKMDEVLEELEAGEDETIVPEALLDKKTELADSKENESESLLHSKLESEEFSQSLSFNGDPVKLHKCDPSHADDYCLVVSFIPSKNIPAGNTLEGYAIYYEAVYGGGEEKAIKVATFWGENARINFKKEIVAGTKTDVNVPLEKYLDNLFFDTPKNESARATLKQKILGIIEDSIDEKNGKKLDREELNTLLTDEYSKITEDENYVALKNKLKEVKAPELSAAGKKAAMLLEKDPKNEQAEEILITEFEKFGKEMALYMLQINRKLILTEAERHGVWLPYGEQKNKLQELKTDIEVYKIQMATIQANLPSFNEQQKLYQEAYDAVGNDALATDIHDQKINQATGVEKKHAARNELYRSSPILSLGDDFNNKGLDADKEEWASKWESFDFKTDAQIIAELKNSIIKQLEKIDEAEENIREEDADFIWDLKEIIPVSIQQAGIANNKNAVKVIQNKIRKEAQYEFIKNIFLIAGGIILSIVSLGQATPFLLAILAGGGALAISTYYVQKDIHDYRLNQSLYDASLQFGQVLQNEDPTMVMIALSLLGMLGDTAQVVRLLKAARATNTAYRTIISLAKAEGLSADEVKALEEMVDLSTRFKLSFTQAEYIQLAAQADRIGMSSRELVDFIFTASRIDKDINAVELLLRMKTWKRVIQPRGYPFKFINKKAFQNFSKATKKILEKYGIPFNDVYIQGSANVTNKAKDIDIAIFVSRKQFDELVERFIQSINNRIQKELTNRLAGENLIKNIKEAAEKGKIPSFYFNRVDELSFDKDFYNQAMIFSTSKEIDISLLVRESSFNLEPMIKLADDPADLLKYFSPASKTIKGINETNDKK